MFLLSREPSFAILLHTCVHNPYVSLKNCRKFSSVNCAVYNNIRYNVKIWNPKVLFWINLKYANLSFFDGALFMLNGNVNIGNKGCSSSDNLHAV
jgi:hypothetical protein